MTSAGNVTVEPPEPSDTVAARWAAWLARSTSPSIFEPSSFRSPVSPDEESPPRPDSASEWMVPLTSILMWNDLVSGPPAMTPMIIEFGSLGLTLCCAPEPPGPAGHVAELLVQALATTTSPANRASALLGRLTTVPPPLGLCEQDWPHAAAVSTEGSTEEPRASRLWI